MENILFTDESLFTREETFNIHNFHFYADENPYVYNIRSYQHKFSINLWAGIYKNFVVLFLIIINAFHVSLCYTTY